MHYTPIGTPQQDRSSVGLIFVDEKDVTHQLSTVGAANPRFEIPPHDPNYKVESSRKFDKDATLLSLFPHMHMRGKSFRYELVLPGQRRTARSCSTCRTTISTGRTRSSWPSRGTFPPAASLHCTAHFDNSSDNLANPDPTKPVRWGPQTWEEMMIGWYDIGMPVRDAEALRSQEQKPAAQEPSPATASPTDK